MDWWRRKWGRGGEPGRGRGGGETEEVLRAALRAVVRLAATVAMAAEEAGGSSVLTRDSVRAEAWVEEAEQETALRFLGQRLRCAFMLWPKVK